MIFPLTAMQIEGFVKEDGISISRYPIENSNIVNVNFGEGIKRNVTFTPNNKDMNSLFEYIKNKLFLTIKSSEVSQYAMDILFSEDENLNKKVEKYIGQGLAKKDAAHAVAKDIIKNNLILKSGSLIKAVISSDKQKNITSRSIISEKDDSGNINYSNSGILNLSLLDNHIPIIIQQKKNPSKFLQVRTSEFIRPKQVELLIQHITNSVNKALELNKEVFYPYFFLENRSLANQINNAAKNKNPSAFLDLLKQIDINQIFSIDMPVALESSFFKTIADDFIGKYTDLLIKLNFFNEDPGVKNEKKEIVKNLFENFFFEQSTLKFYGVYNIPTPRLGKVESWGYLKNNISANLALSLKSQYKIAKAIGLS